MGVDKKLLDDLLGPQDADSEPFREGVAVALARQKVAYAPPVPIESITTDEIRARLLGEVFGHAITRSDNTFDYKVGDCLSALTLIDANPFMTRAARTPVRSILRHVLDNNRKLLWHAEVDDALGAAFCLTAIDQKVSDHYRWLKDMLPQGDALEELMHREYLESYLRNFLGHDGNDKWWCGFLHRAGLYGMAVRCGAHYAHLPDEELPFKQLKMRDILSSGPRHDFYSQNPPLEEVLSEVVELTQRGIISEEALQSIEEYIKDNNERNPNSQLPLPSAALPVLETEMPEHRFTYRNYQPSTLARIHRVPFRLRYHELADDVLVESTLWHNRDGLRTGHVETSRALHAHADDDALVCCSKEGSVLFDTSLAIQLLHQHELLMQDIWNHYHHEYASATSIYERIHQHLKKVYPRLQRRDEVTELLVDRYKFVIDHPASVVEGGYSSEFVIDVTNDMAKFAPVQQNEAEHRVYKHKSDLGEWGKFIAESRGEPLELGPVSLLILENLKERPPADLQAAKLYATLTDAPLPWLTQHEGHNKAMLNLFLLGYAHKDLWKIYYEDFPIATYCAPDGTPHYAMMNTPLPQTSNETYRAVLKPLSDRFIARVGNIVQGYMQYGRPKEGKMPIIIADNKVIDNSCNGYPLDFSTVGHGKVIEDIAYGIVEPRLGIPLQHRHAYVNAYVDMRCLHDKGFKEWADKSGRVEMHAFFDAATVLALSRYLGSTRKRIEQMEDRSIWPRRAYFIRALQHMLKNGEYSAIGM